MLSWCTEHVRAVLQASSCTPVTRCATLPLSLNKPMTALVAHMVLSVLTRQAELPSDVAHEAGAISSRVPEQGQGVGCVGTPSRPPMNGPLSPIFFLLPHLVASVL